MNARIFLLVFFLWASLGCRSAAAPLDQWLWSNPIPQGNSLNAIAHGGGRFVAVGQLGTILTSADGTNWSSVNSGTLETLADCTYGNGLFVAVGSFGAILTSPNGEEWTPQFGGTFYSLKGVTYGNGLFVAVGEETTILTSSDAVIWTQRANGPIDLADVAFGNGAFVAVGESTLLTSTNGLAWARRNASLYGSLRGIHYADGKFVAVGGSIDWDDRYQNIVAVSEDATTWTTTYFKEAQPLQSVAFGGGQWISVAASIYADPFLEDSSGSILISSNLTHWSMSVSNAGPVLDVISADGRFVAVSHNGSVLTSPDGVSWENVGGPSLIVPYSFSALEFVNGHFLSLALDRVSFSTDGATWTNTHVFTEDYQDFLYSVAYGNGRYVAGGEYQRVFVSTNGRDWTLTAPELSVKPYVADVDHIIFTGTRFLGVSSYNGNVLVSPDGLNWTARSLRTNSLDYFYSAGVACSSNSCVVMGDFGQFAVSSDLTNWLRVLGPTAMYMTSITYGHGRFVAVGDRGIASSTDGTNWVVTRMDSFGELRDVAFGGGFFVAVGRDLELPGPSSPSRRIIWVSTNGTDWLPRTLDTSLGLSHVAYGDGKFVIAGDRSLLMRSYLNASQPSLSIAIANGFPHLKVHGVPGRSYSLECVHEMSGATPWEAMATLSAPTGTVSYTDTNPPPYGRRFYRAVIGSP